MSYIHKNTKIDYLSQIPIDWDFLKIKFVSDCNQLTLSEQTDPLFEFNYVDISSINSTRGITNTTKMNFDDAPSRARRIVQNGDTIISTVRTYLKAIAYIEGNINNLVVSTGFAVFSPNKMIENKYFSYYFQNQNFIDSVMAFSKGVNYPAIDSFDLKNLFIVVPLLTEQKQIAAFLDYKTNQIDNLIEKKEKLFKLLEEKRIALITKAVTKGIAPNIKMKPTGIDWLGEIPEHWDITAIKRLCKISYGVGGEIDKTISDGVRLLSLPNVRIDGKIDLTEEYYTDVEDEAYLLHKGDLLFNWRNGSSSHLGKTVYFDIDGSFTNVSFLLRLRFSQSTNSRYYYYLLNSLRATGFFASSKAGVNNTFNLNELSNLPVFIPPITEQNNIVRHLDDRLKGIIKLSEQVTQALEKLKEYKTAVITAAVTGKIDVRNWTPKEESKDDSLLKEVQDELK